MEMKPKAKPKTPRLKRSEETLPAFLDRCRSECVKPIPETDPIFQYAVDVGLTAEMIDVSWFVFKRKHTESSKTQKDWRAHYRNSVRSNWLNLWYISAGKPATLSTPGHQALLEMEALQRRAA